MTDILNQEQLGLDEYESKINDSQALVLHQPNKDRDDGKTLNIARKARKKAQDEVKALENRIMLLKKEEERAKRRIYQTKKRAEQIVRIREENLRRKRQVQRELSKKVPAAPAATIVKQRVEKELGKAARRKYMKDIYMKKKSKAQTFRSERKKLEEDVSLQKQQAQQEAKLKTERIRKQKEEAARKAQRRKEELMEKARLEYKKKVTQEKNAVKKYEGKAKHLERMEAELIQKLQRTQIVQEKAYSKLKDALAPTSP